MWYACLVLTPMFCISDRTKCHRGVVCVCVHVCLYLCVCLCDTSIYVRMLYFMRATIFKEDDWCLSIVIPFCEHCILKRKSCLYKPRKPLAHEHMSDPFTYQQPTHSSQHAPWWTTHSMNHGSPLHMSTWAAHSPINSRHIAASTHHGERHTLWTTEAPCTWAHERPIHLSTAGT